MKTIKPRPRVVEELGQPRLVWDQEDAVMAGAGSNPAYPTIKKHIIKTQNGGLTAAACRDVLKTFRTKSMGIDTSILRKTWVYDLNH